VVGLMLEGAQSIVATIPDQDDVIDADPIRPPDPRRRLASPGLARPGERRARSGGDCDRRPPHQHGPGPPLASTPPAASPHDPFDCTASGEAAASAPLHD